MIARDLAEQSLELPGDDAAVDSLSDKTGSGPEPALDPPADAALPVADPVEPEPDSIDAWRALVAKLQARIAEIEGPPDRLLTLKVAAYTEHVDGGNLRR
jgi:hypothetical protein